MREDYKYIDKATSICLTTTSLGDRFVERASDAETVSGLGDLLNAIQNEYFLLPSNMPIDNWWSSYKLQYRKANGVSSPTTLQDFERALLKGLMTVRKVIWD